MSPGLGVKGSRLIQSGAVFPWIFQLFAAGGYSRCRAANPHTAGVPVQPPTSGTIPANWCLSNVSKSSQLPWEGNAQPLLRSEGRSTQFYTSAAAPLSSSVRMVKGLGDIKGSPLTSKSGQWPHVFTPRGEGAEIGLCLQTPSHHPGSIQQRKLHQLQGCGKAHNQVRMLRRNNLCSHGMRSPEGLAHPRAGRWGGHVPFMSQAQHQGGADRMVSLVPGGSYHSCSPCPSRMDKSTCV